MELPEQGTFFMRDTADTALESNIFSAIIKAPGMIVSLTIVCGFLIFGDKSAYS